MTKNTAHWLDLANAEPSDVVNHLVTLSASIRAQLEPIADALECHAGSKHAMALYGIVEHAATCEMLATKLNGGLDTLSKAPIVIFPDETYVLIERNGEEVKHPLSETTGLDGGTTKCLEDGRYVERKCIGILHRFSQEEDVAQ